MEEIAARLAEIPGVIAVTLGGSRARGEELPDSDWDFGLYYRDKVDPADVAALGWPDEVTARGGWGPIVNGGAWLTIDGEKVDLCYRNIDEVNHEVVEAEHGRFRIWNLPNCVAGIPSYVLVGELALCRVLTGELPRPGFPDALAAAAPQIWRQQGSFTFHTAEMHAHRGEVLATVANMARATIAEAQARLAERREWTLNEKGILERSGLNNANELFVAPGSNPEELLASTRRLRQISTSRDCLRMDIWPPKS